LFLENQVLKTICVIASLLIFAGCAESPRPTVYRGGRYYGDAVHADKPNER
jgi:hypothetical protein